MQGPGGGFEGNESYPPEPWRRRIPAEAIKRWQAAGLIEAQIAKLREVKVVIEDIDGAYLGARALHDTTVRLDINANGYGWYVDATPGDDSEFANAKSAARLYTTPDQAPAGRMDLLTVLMH